MSDVKLENIETWGNKPSNFLPTNQILLHFDNESHKNNFLNIFLSLANHFSKCRIACALSLTNEELQQVMGESWIVIDFSASSEKLFNLVKDKVETDIKVISHTIENQIIKVLPETDFIGFQRHKVDLSSLHHVDAYSLGSTSLGMIKNRHTELEPIFRTVQFIDFHLNSGKACEWPLINSCLPTGLTVEEISQIFRYGGSSYKIEYLGMNGLLGELYENNESLMSLSIPIWYFIEGVDSRVFKNDFSISGFQEFVVNVKDIEESLVFSINTDDGKWWVRVEDGTSMIPCSKEDYERASMGFVSDRLFRKLFT